MKNNTAIGGSRCTLRTSETCSLTIALAFAVHLTVPIAGRAQTMPDPFAHRDTAKAAAAANPLAAPHVTRAMGLLTALGLDPSYSFQPINAGTDDLGYTHVRLREYFHGVRVRKGMLISHADPRGVFSPDTDALKRNINISVRPTLTPGAAFAFVTRSTTVPVGPTAFVKTELVVNPIEERVSRPIVGQPVSQDAAAAKIDAHPLAVPDPINADETVLQVKEYRLAYEFRTVEGSERSAAGPSAWIHYVDANTGQILEQRPLVDSAIGSGKGKFTNGVVSFNTTAHPTGFNMYDGVRNFYTEDDDFSSSDPQNRDADDTWGDGMAFKGDAAATTPNRQTAMVDGMFGSTVYWDLMSNVFKRKGPNNNLYDVNVLVHYGTNLDDAQYYYASGNIHLGDGKSRQALDCLGHENGHGLQDFTVGFDDGGESGGLNESDSDIWGAMTTFYLGGGAFANSSSTIPAAGGSWQSICSGRNMQQPSAGTRVQSDYWFPAIGNLTDVHDIAAPNNRAFYFLSQGASAYMTQPSHSALLPWGMTGVGNQKAAQIWYDALVYYMDDDADYTQARNAAMAAAFFRYGLFSPELAAVQNAYAGINVGQRASTYPALPPVTLESESNNTFQTANLVPHTHPIPGNLQKASAKGGGGDNDWFKVSLNPGEKMTVRLGAPYPANYDLIVYDHFLSVDGKSTNGFSTFDIVTIQASFFANGPLDYYVRVVPVIAGPATNYTLDFDFFPAIKDKQV